jgi:soluble lytic murein transglycosylase-like protein
MARILPASVFKANFNQKDLKPSLGAQGRAAWLSPGGIKTAVEITDAVGGTISDAVSRYARKQSEIARLRREDKKLKEEGILGKLYASAEDEKLLEGKTYEAGQAAVAGATTREDRAAGYDTMRKAFNKPGSGRLLADPRRDPSRLLAEDYARLAAASPLPKDADLKADSLGKSKTVIKIGPDAANRAKDSVALTEGVNRALVLRENLKGIEYDPLAENDPNLVRTIIQASNGMFVPHMVRSGDKSIPSVRLRDDFAKEAFAALDPQDTEGRKQIQATLHQQALAALRLRNNPNLNDASTKLQRFNDLSTRYRQAGESGALGSFDPNELKELNALQAELSAAGNNVPFFLMGTGQQRTLRDERRAKAENEFAGKAREQLEAIKNAEATRELTDDEVKEKGLLESTLRKIGIDPDTGSAPLQVTPGSGSTATATVASNQEDIWQSAGGSSGTPNMTTGSPNMNPVSDAPPAAAPAVAPAAAPVDTYMQIAERMRQAGISEENIGIALPGFQFDTVPPSLMDRFRGDTKRKPIRYDRNITGSQRTTGNQRGRAAREDAIKAPLRAKTIARMEAAAQKAEVARRKTGPSSKAPTEPFLIKKQPVSIGTKDIKQKVGGKTVTHKFPIYNAKAVGAKSKKRRLPNVSAKDKARRIKLLRAAAKKYKIDSDLYVALADQESLYHDKAVSDQYAIGLTQITPSAWLDIGGKPEDFKTLFDESVAAESGAKFLSLIRKRLIKSGGIKKNDPKENEKIMAVYNAGPSAFKNEGFEINSKKRKDGTFFSGLMNPKRSVPLRDAKGNKIFAEDKKGNKIPLKGKDGKQLKDKKGKLRWKIKTRIGETYNYVTKIMKNYKKIKALSAKPGPKAPKEES